MKRFILFLIVLGIRFFSFSQCISDNYLLNFEETCSLPYLINDTINAPDNIWRVGTPEKNIFTSANSSPNAIITDLNNPYPSNNISPFIITFVVSDLHAHEHVGIGGSFMSNTDSLVDYVKLEISFDHGASWIDLLDSTVIEDNNLLWSTDYGAIPPSFTGNSNGWKWFAVNTQQLYSLNNQLHGDTSLYRFTFISDGNQTNKDGLMFDDLYL
jgi:hypothetical protein